MCYYDGDSEVNCTEVIIKCIYIFVGTSSPHVVRISTSFLPCGPHVIKDKFPVEFQQSWTVTTLDSSTVLTSPNESRDSTDTCNEISIIIIIVGF